METLLPLNRGSLKRGSLDRASLRLAFKYSLQAISKELPLESWKYPGAFKVAPKFSTGFRLSRR